MDISVFYIYYPNTIRDIICKQFIYKILKLLGKNGFINWFQYTSGAKPYREKINYGNHYNDIRLTKKHDVRNGFVDCLNTTTKGYLRLVEYKCSGITTSCIK